MLKKERFGLVLLIVSIAFISNVVIASAQLYNSGAGGNTNNNQDAATTGACQTLTGKCPDSTSSTNNDHYVNSGECEPGQKGCFNDGGKKKSSLSPDDFGYYCADRSGGANADKITDADEFEAACSCIHNSDWKSGVHQNKRCCGDDVRDCGAFYQEKRLAVTIDWELCRFDNSYTGKWISADENPGKAYDIVCKNEEYISLHGRWAACLKTGTTEYEGNDYLCIKNQKQWRACCGDDICSSNKRVAVGDAFVI